MKRENVYTQLGLWPWATFNFVVINKKRVIKTFSVASFNHV